MRIRQSFRWIVIVLTLAMAAVMLTPAYAQDNSGDSKLQSILTVDPIQSQPIGETITLMAHLKNKDGEGNSNKVLIAYLNDQVLRRTRTDDQGNASIRVGSELLAGSYTIRVEFPGTQAYLPATASTSVIIRPALLTVNTVPPLANVPFALDGQKFESDAQGVAQISVTKLGDYKLEVLLQPDTTISDDTRVTFDRWRDEYQPERTITVNGDTTMQAGFSVSHPVSQTFSDLENNPVDMERIDTITIQGTDGSKFTFDDGSVRWLRGGRIARRQNGLEATQIMYSVESVILNGSNTVNRYQQRFFVKPNDVWPIQLLLYHATFRAADAVFGFPVGKGVSIVYPDGHDEFIAFDANHVVKIGPVPRGVYKVKVVGASGMAPETPLALSRNQELDLKVLSTLNMGLGASLGFIGVVGLLLLGRPYLPRVVYQTTRDIVTLRILKNNKEKQALLPAKVRYALPESSVIQSSQEGAAPIITVVPEVIEIAPARAPAPEVAEEATIVEEAVSSKPVEVGTAVQQAAAAVGPNESGHFGLQDTYHVGSLDGINDIYQQTYIDVYSGIALVKLYDRKDGRAAADMLNNIVVPWFDAHQLTIKQITTDRGREYVGTGKQKTHQYQTALADIGIVHSKNNSKDPQYNAVCSEFHQLMSRELYNPILMLSKGKAERMSLEALQTAVDNWLKWYNTERPFNGQAEGETPIERLTGKKASV